MRSLLSRGRAVAADGYANEGNTGARVSLSSRRWVSGVVTPIGVALAVFAFTSIVASSALASSAPIVAREWSSDIGRGVATVNAIVNPMTLDTTYRFEYGQDASYGTSVPVPDGDVGSGSEEIAVSQLANVQAGTTYHYRVVAANAEGSTHGADKTFTTSLALTTEPPDHCPNAALRRGLSPSLPDCRAYEMVSPVDKNGADINGQNYKEFAAAENGERVEFPTRTGMGDTHGSGYGGFTQFVASRGADGWVTKGITSTPALNTPLMLYVGGTWAKAFSNELERAVVTGYSLPGVSGAVKERENLYLEDVLTGDLIEPITRFEGPEGTSGYFVASRIGGGSSDLGVTTFVSSANLVSPASGTEQKLYALAHGKLELVGIMPDGSLPPEGSTTVRGPDRAIALKDTVSRDGSRIFFMSPATGGGQLYVRENGTRTVLISQSEATVSSAASNVEFQAATPDGAKVVFSTETRLLDADPGGPGMAMYLYTDSPSPEAESNLTFIARFSGGGEAVKGISEDGTHIYFMSQYSETLPFKTIGSGLFLWDDGEIRQVAPEPGALEQTVNTEEEARISADGHRIVFMNNKTITRQEVLSLSIIRAVSNTELYLYDEDSDTLKCISCPPSGAAATSGVEMTVRATSEFNPGFYVPQSPRFYSKDGRYAFFNTIEALVPQDTNGLTDAYEYDVETGKLSLLSSGTGDDGTWFVDASANGSDVFLLTRQALTGWDPDKLVDLYDARVNGGLPEPSPSAVPCAGDECQGTPSATPDFNTASGFNGLGNQARSVAKKVKSKSLSRAQLLGRALNRCGKRPKRMQARCKATARKRYSTKNSAKHASRRAGR